MGFFSFIGGGNKQPQSEAWREKLNQQNSTSNSSNNIEDSNPLHMFVRSVDTLNGKQIDETLPSTREWPIKPPIIQPTGNTDHDLKLLKRLCRSGIPPVYRSAIWITSVVTISRPYQSKEETELFGTLMKVEILEHGWEVVKKSIFSDESDEEAATIPDFGMEPKKMEGLLVNDHFLFVEGYGDDEFQGTLSQRAVEGVHLITIFLYAVRQNLGIEYCPLLPDMTALLLSYMPVSYAFCAIREMTNTENYYLPLSKVEYLTWCKTFGDLMRRMYPQTAVIMKKCGALTPDGLDPIFRRFFVTILTREQVCRILDIYFIEGYKAIFRIGTVLLCLATYYLTAEETTSTAEFWKGVKRVTASRIFHFDVLIKQAYGFDGRRYRSRRSFPRRRFIQRLMSYNEEWANKSSSNHVLNFMEKPLGFIEGEIPIVLAKNASERLRLEEFLPFAYKSTKLDLIFSTNFHGRSLDLFYQHCARTKHTVTLVEVLNNGATIGMFATDTWHNNRKMYGDGECVLFRLKPNAVCFHWQHSSTTGLANFGSRDLSSVSADSYISDDETETIQSESLNGQFMISTNKFISMGSNENGGSGLRLNEDLSMGSSSKARGFNNEPLAGDNLIDFDVGLVEVYQLVREVDGRSIDGDEDVWKGMFD